MGWVLLCLGLGFGLMGRLAWAQDGNELADTLDTLRASVVAVGTYQYTRRPQSQFRGTGFVVGDGRFVVTNNHVLPDLVDESKKEYVAVFAGEGKRVKVVRSRVLARDPVHDLALLKMDKGRLPPFRLADDSKVREGQLFAFTGFPIGMVLGLHPVTHRGIVSALTPVIDPVYRSEQLNPRLIRRLRDPYKVFQLDATAYPGNSGSPLYRIEDGRLVGVINSVFVKETKELVIQKPSGITYAIPARFVKQLLRDNAVPES